MARSYVDFQPSWNRVEGDDSDTVFVQLPGFVKEQLRAQLDNFGNIKISGERPIEGKKWSRFRKEFRIPDHCNTKEVRASFENEILSVIMPKTKPITSPSPVHTKKPTQPSPAQKPSQPAKDSKPAATGSTQGKMSEKKQQESDAAEKMTPNSSKSPFPVQNNKPTQPSQAQKPPQPNTDQNSTQQKQTSFKPPVSAPITQRKMSEKKGEESGAAEKMIPNRNRSNEFGMMGKQESRGPHVGAAETVREERYGRGGGLKMMLEGLQKHKPSKLVVNVVVGVMVAVALGVGAYVALFKSLQRQMESD